ncbi:MAG: phosphoglycerate kinase [Bernardetiaceae bacterium]
MRTLDDFSFAGRRALVRVDFNVPLDAQHRITDDTRLRATLPTIQKILSDGGSAVLISHLGRPKGTPDPKFSLRHVVGYLQEALGVPVHFAPGCTGEATAQQASRLPAGEVLLLENLRFHAAEKKGDRTFAAELAAYGDVYVNDAFGTAHRAHASVAIVPEFFADKLAGYVLAAEIKNAQKVLQAPERPFVAIMGGAKISDKILVIERLLDQVDHLLIGGAMAYTFVKAQGGAVGSSLVEEDQLELALRLIAMAKEKNVQLLLPQDSQIADDFSNAAQRKTADNHAIPEAWMGLDIGPKATAAFAEVIEAGKTILWNGPMGVFEFDNFSGGTRGVAEALVAATQKGAFSLIGGGDSAAAINQLGFGDQVSYVSTGGGALLEYMEGKVLPGVAALD